MPASAPPRDRRPSQSPTATTQSRNRPRAPRRNCPRAPSLHQPPLGPHPLHPRFLPLRHHPRPRRHLVVIVALTAHGAFQELLGVHPALLQLLAHSLHLEVLILIPGIRIVTFVVVVGVVGFILLIITILVVVVGILHVAAILQDAQLPQALLARVELGGHLVSLLLERLRHLLLIVQRRLTVVGLGLLGRLLLPVFIPGRVFIGPGEVKVTVEVVASVAAVLARFFLFFFGLVAVQPALLGGAFSLPLRLGAARGVSPAGRTHVIVGDAVVVRVHRVHSLQTSL